jgi:excisionase family DNA binding protein
LLDVSRSLRKRENTVKPLLTPDDVAEILSISPRTVNELCNRKKLGYIQVDAKHRRFTEEMVQEFVDRQTVQSQRKGAQRSRVSTSQQIAEQSLTGNRKPCAETAQQLKAEMDAF